MGWRQALKYQVSLITDLVLHQFCYQLYGRHGSYTGDEVAQLFIRHGIAF